MSILRVTVKDHLIDGGFPLERLKEVTDGYKLTVVDLGNNQIEALGKIAVLPYFSVSVKRSGTGVAILITQTVPNEEETK